MKTSIFSKLKILERFVNSSKKKSKNAASYEEIVGRYELEQFRVAQDRYSIVKDVNLLCGPNGDIRFQRANMLIADDATRNGFSIIVNGSSADRKRRIRQGLSPARLSPGADRVQRVLDAFLERTRLHVLCTEHAAALLRDGDLFLNVLVDEKSGLVTQVRRAPPLSIKRNANEYGEFSDPVRAFSQVDVSRIYEMTGKQAPPDSRMDFALYQMNHIRWMAEETRNYGTSQYAVSRKCYRMLAEMEKALVNRRLCRSVSKHSHELDTADMAEIEEYKRANRMVDSDGNPTMNSHMLADYVGNAKITALHDEANLDEVKDIGLIEDTLWINLLVPKAIITGGQGINRDVLKVQYPHYLQSLESITDRLEYGDSGAYSGYRAIIDLQLMLAGINPEAVSYDVVWSQKTWETMAERVAGIQAALGAGGGKQLISHEKAVQLVATDFDIEDPAAMYQRILEENGPTDTIKKKNRSALPFTDGGQSSVTDSQNSFPLPYSNEERQAILDEALEDRDSFEGLQKDFQEEWESFFRGLFSAIEQTGGIKDKQEADQLGEREWEEQMKLFLPVCQNYMYQAGYLGAEMAKRILRNGQETALQDDVRIRFNIQQPDIYKDLLQQCGKRIVRIKQTVLEKIRRTAAEGFQNGVNWRTLMKRLEPVIQDSTRAEMIALTELSWAYNRQAERSYERAGVEQVYWDASPDMRTCDKCADLHGQVFPINGHPDQPAHPRCRCILLPVLRRRGST